MTSISKKRIFEQVLKEEQTAIKSLLKPMIKDIWTVGSMVRQDKYPDDTNVKVSEVLRTLTDLYSSL